MLCEDIMSYQHNIYGCRAFTLIEALVTLGVISMLAAILLPSMNNAREAARRVMCASNLRQIHDAVQMYADDHSGWMPPKFEVKKTVLSAQDLANGKQLNTLSNGIQTLLGRYVSYSKKVFYCPSDSGDATSNISVFLRRGTSYDVQGFDLKVETDPKKQAEKNRKNRFNLKSTREIARDLFKPWDSDDLKKVQEKIAKGELGPIKWHKKKFQMILGDGHVVTISSKTEDKEIKGGVSDD